MHHNLDAFLIISFKVYKYINFIIKVFIFFVCWFMTEKKLIFYLIVNINRKQYIHCLHILT